MTREQIASMQRRIRASYAAEDREDCDDGFWGEKSQAACRRHLRALMPVPNPWPTSKPADIQAFYGEPGDTDQLVRITFPYRMLYGGKAVTTTMVHHKCAPSLLRILKRIEGLFADAPDIVDEATDYGGCYNFRPKRSGGGWSLHAYGAAIDLDADDNTFRDAWPVAADMPIEIMEEFAREGWKSAGAFWGYDAMHFEATR